MCGASDEELRGHLDGQRVGLELLGDDGAPDVPAARDLLRRPRRLRDRRHLAPRQVARLPLGLLRQLVEAEDALGARVLGMGDDLVDELTRLHADTLTGLARGPIQVQPSACRYQRA